MKIIKKIFIGFLMSILLLTLSVNFFSLNQKYIFKNMDKSSNISQKDYIKISKKISQYLKNDIDTLEFKISLNSNIVSAFNKREQIHMKDVKQIFIYLKYIKYIIILILLIVFLKAKKYFYESTIYSIFISIIFTIFLLFIINTNFTSSFIKFHEMFFSNDLWLLNPRTDLLINLLPQEFFMDIAKNILFMFFILEVMLSSLFFIRKKL